MHDTISRIICNDLNLRAYAVTSLNTTKHITELHNTTPNATYALGRTINAAALLSATLKPGSDQNVLIKFSGNGPIKEIHVQADARGNIRGYVANPFVDVTNDIKEINFSKIIGAGILTVSRDIGMKEPYESIIPLQTGDIANDISYYLTISEQIPSAVILGLNINTNGEILSSGGILIQTFPDTKDEVIEMVEKNIFSIKEPLGDYLIKNNDINFFVSRLFDNHPVDILDSYPLTAACRCDKFFLKDILLTFTDEELHDMIAKDKGAKITCTFCKKAYYFNENELELIRKKRKGDKKGEITR